MYVDHTKNQQLLALPTSQGIGILLQKTTVNSLSMVVALVAQTTLRHWLPAEANVKGLLILQYMTVSIL